MSQPPSIPVYARRIDARNVMAHFTDAVTNTPMFLESDPGGGKSTFVLNDLHREAIRSNYLPVYIDLKENADAPAEVLRQGIARAIVYLNQSGNLANRTMDLLRRIFVADVEKIELEVAAVRLAIRDSRDDGANKVISRGAEELPALMRVLSERALARERPVLLIIDHADLLPPGVAGVLQSALFQHRLDRSLSAVLVTGTREAQWQLFGKFNSPFHGFQESYRLRPFGDGFIRAMSQAILEPRGIEIPMKDLRRALSEFNHRPAAFMRVLEGVIRNPKQGIDRAIHAIQLSERNGSSSQAHARTWASLAELDRLIVRDLAYGRSPVSPSRIAFYNERLGADSIATPSTVAEAMHRLVDARVLTGGDGSYSIRNPSLLLWARGKGPYAASEMSAAEAAVQGDIVQRAAIADRRSPPADDDEPSSDYQHEAMG